MKTKSSKKNEMTRKTRNLMYPGSLIYAISIASGFSNILKAAILLSLTIVLTFLIDEPIKGFLKKLVTVFLFLLFVGALMGIVLLLIKLLILKFIV
ncbi:hypothetical protein [Paenibacillus eucommiae]|uniref:Uncharacterized protein n=1 Tax=Paenibacillus eucommiae TaxID=1355755 RepID=A0ABS4ISR5_9BACL|nr:hypothetical protein [Paenibacillus eucommiae]MBP1990612.1 hypothetical protein [Paenibacillus eucommiae]